MSTATHPHRFFVTAIGTDSGKTLVSSILCQALGAGYFKPVQAGLPRDTDTVASLVSHPHFCSYPEAYLLNTPESPHAAAAKDGVHIRFQDIALPSSTGPLVVEGAGGLMVPLNDQDLVIDLVAHLGLDILLVANLYLGSINHTLLSIEALHHRGLPLKGIIFNGPPNADSERIILQRAGVPCILRVEQEPRVDASVVEKYAKRVKFDDL
jgi:dethiobiotin synthetase